MMAQENKTPLVEDVPPQEKGAHIPVVPHLANGVDADTDSLDESVKRLDVRLQRMESALRAFGSRHSETWSHVTRMRQNAIKRFRVWKAVTSSRTSKAANLSPDDGEDQRVTPIPLTQYPMYRSATDEVGSQIARVGKRDQTILGEIAFQVERRIIAFVFQGKEILYGYNLGKIN